MEIIEYQENYKKDFIALNIDWIRRYFVPEQADYDVLDNVDKLLQKGSMIYFAVENGAVLATCMATPLQDTVWEIQKLAATGQYTGKGAGSAVFRACMDYAIAHGAQKLTLISNRRLKPALHIYKKFGFQEIPLQKDYWGFDRADIEFEYTVVSHELPQADNLTPSADTVREAAELH